MSEGKSPSIQWFPGHMAKTRRLMQANLKLVDLVAELRDARIPYSSQNPEIDKIIGSKPRIILLNKKDIADNKITNRWCDYYKSKNIPVIAVDCRSGQGLNLLRPLVEATLEEKITRFRDKGMAGRPLRLMIVGIPNVGKSSLINRLASAKKTKVEDRPGVTRGKQWIKIHDGMELLDMPGVLWPKFEDQTVAKHLAFTGAIKDDVMDLEHLAAQLLETLSIRYPQQLANRYNIAGFSDETKGYLLLEEVAKNRGMLLLGGEKDTNRAAIAVLDEFRAGKIGNITLDLPPER